MPWTKTSEHSWRNGPYTIAHALVGSADTFTAWRGTLADKDLKLLGHFPDYEGARQAAVRDHQQRGAPIEADGGSAA